ncbi:MAG: hypothetical protein WKF59_16145 [Chitinophagaceae bacterium]
MMTQELKDTFQDRLVFFIKPNGACYEDVMTMQIEEAVATKGKGDLDKLIRGRETWTIN